jgi:uncharacterized protein YceH (UPF0502 family)
MTLEVDVDCWLRETNPALEPALRRVTEVILATDARLTAYIKNGTLQFAYEGDMAAFVQPKGSRVSLMFYRGAKIPGEFPHLEGEGHAARFLRFDDLADVRSKTKELRTVAKAWCRLMTQA